MHMRTPWMFGNFLQCKGRNYYCPVVEMIYSHSTPPPSTNPLSPITTSNIPGPPPKKKILQGTFSWEPGSGNAPNCVSWWDTFLPGCRPQVPGENRIPSTLLTAAAHVSLPLPSWAASQERRAKRPAPSVPGTG